jgi:3-methylcrotonyl-CoA carboxylase alpha subunit
MPPVARPIRRLLIANRGEIAVRIIRACRELDIESVAVYSTVDAAAPHTVAADYAVPVGPAPAVESYLAIPRIIDAARASGADAVHPGYGFLAENPALAIACEESGLAFVGPPAEAMAAMGSKIEARRLMAAAGVPVVPGEVPADQSDEGIAGTATRFGFPVLLKASAGGGGKGMRTAHTAEGIEAAVRSARREAEAAFGDGTLYVERLIARPRHIEIQVLADHHGAVVHLFERDCSVQRRHQKVIEESPAPGLAPHVRDGMGRAAVAAARAVGYRNAGTIEFLYEEADGEPRFHFLEMNTRLQVEHPVTEAVLGIDLVRAQIRVASGEPLPWRQEDLSPRGHAIECRVYAENPHRDFLPQAGRLLRYREPSGPGIRVDSGIREGSEVTVHYDPLLAKLIAAGETRAAALARAHVALRAFAILGIRSNIGFLRRVIEHPDFQIGGVDITFTDRAGAALLGEPAVATLEVAAAAAAAHELEEAEGAGAQRNRHAMPLSRHDPWDLLNGWRV